MKISNLMDLPPVALMSGLDRTTRQINYPEPLLRLWKRCSEDEKNPAQGRSPGTRIFNFPNCDTFFD